MEYTKATAVYLQEKRYERIILFQQVLRMELRDYKITLFLEQCSRQTLGLAETPKTINCLLSIINEMLNSYKGPIRRGRPTI